MQYFTVQAPSHSEAEQRVRVQYGDHARILTHRTIRLGGFLGLFSREGIEVTGYLAAEAPKKKNLDPEEEKKKILATVKNEQTLQALYKEVLAIKGKPVRMPTRCSAGWNPCSGTTNSPNPSSVVLSIGSGVISPSKSSRMKPRSKKRSST
jgi:hypothetical protein